MNKRPNSHTIVYGLFFPYRVGESGCLKKIEGFNWMKERPNGHKFLYNLYFLYRVEFEGSLIKMEGFN